MKMKKLPSEANSEQGDLSGEGRLGENRELMDKNRIEGRHGASRGHNTPKTSGMPVEVNPAAVRWSNVQLPGEISPPQGGEKSAEVIVIGKTSRGRDARSNSDTGGLPTFLSGHARLHFPPPENDGNDGGTPPPAFNR